MKKINVVIILMILLLPMVCNGQKSLFSSNWSSDSMKIDGVFSDWNFNLKQDKKSKVFYCIANDNTSLLLCFKVTDAGVKNKIMMMGLTIWVDTTGKQKELLGIKYPMGRGGSMGQRPQEGTRPTSPDQPRQRVDRAPILDRVELIGFKEKRKSEVVNISDMKGIEVAVMEDQYGGMQYEARISLDKLFIDHQRFLSNDESLISIGFETGYIKTNTSAGGGGHSGQMGGGRPPGGGGRPPGGGRQGGMAPQQGDMATMTQATRLWLKRIKLAIKE